MKTKIFLAGLLMAYSFVSVFGQTVLTAKHLVYFETASSRVSPTEKKQLLQLLDNLKMEEIVGIKIIGHTDQRGSDKMNEGLSYRRAETVRNFVAKSIRSTQIEFEWKGEQNLLSANLLPESLQKNRRVEIIISYQKSEKDATPVVTKDISTATHEDSLLWLLDQLKAPYQSFYIDPNKDTVIYGSQGTVIGIPANSFDLKGKRNWVVEFKLKEVYDPADMVLENLYTQSDGQLLASQGMIETRAFVDGVETDLLGGASISVSMPADSINPNSKLFSGKRNNKTHGVNNWTAMNQNNFQGLSFQSLGDCICSYGTISRFCIRSNWFKYNVLKFKYQLERRKRYTYNKMDMEYKIQKILRQKNLPESFISITRIIDKNWDYNYRYDFPTFKPSSNRFQKIEFRLCPPLDCGKSSQILNVLRPLTLNDLLTRQRELMDSMGVGSPEQLFQKLNDIAQAKLKKQAQLATYVFTQNQLGWRNIDYFYHKSDEKKVNVLASTNKPEFKGICQLMFNKIKVQVPANWTGSNYASDNVGAGYSMAIICLDIMDGKPCLGIRKTKSSEEVEHIEILPNTVSGIRQAVKVALAN